MKPNSDLLKRQLGDLLSNQRVLPSAKLCESDPMMFEIVMDRPIGTVHPKHPDLIYPINYGYIEGIIAPDGEEQDVYLLGVDHPVERYTARVFAIIHRNDDIEEKWVACPAGQSYTAAQVEELTHFQEQYYDSYVMIL